jgi:hypothetical protein
MSRSEQKKTGGENIIPLATSVFFAEEREVHGDFIESLCFEVTDIYDWICR